MQSLEVQVLLVVYKDTVFVKLVINVHILCD